MADIKKAAAAAKPVAKAVAATKPAEAKVFGSMTLVRRQLI